MRYQIYSQIYKVILWVDMKITVKRPFLLKFCIYLYDLETHYMVIDQFIKESTSQWLQSKYMDRYQMKVDYDDH